MSRAVPNVPGAGLLAGRKVVDGAAEGLAQGDGTNSVADLGNRGDSPRHRRR